MSESRDDTVVIALDVRDPALLDRLVAAFARPGGVRLAAPGEVADATLSAREAPARSGPTAGLTARELEVLALLAEGASNKVVARRLGISVNTAKFHVASLLDKLDAVGRVDAVTHAARLGVIDL